MEKKDIYKVIKEKGKRKRNVGIFQLILCVTKRDNLYKNRGLPYPILYKTDRSPD